ncbi:hypothetical protein TNCT_633361 [Trichonephila clavata]|uniref:Uncharacterized protein n=1 Tax=Trichonephila clavata TaxID=2740835 RepID=A0A8X6LR85_TRICU|nr:hypothetical protein TNCT_633361 [Trichonephila clavata]
MNHSKNWTRLSVCACASFCLKSPFPKCGCLALRQTMFCAGLLHSWSMPSLDCADFHLGLKPSLGDLYLSLLEIELLLFFSASTEEQIRTGDVLRRCGVPGQTLLACCNLQWRQTVVEIQNSDHRALRWLHNSDETWIMAGSLGFYMVLSGSVRLSFSGLLFTGQKWLGSLSLSAQVQGIVRNPSGLWSSNAVSAFETSCMGLVVKTQSACKVDSNCEIFNKWSFLCTAVLYNKECTPLLKNLLAICATTGSLLKRHGILFISDHTASVTLLWIKSMFCLPSKQSSGRSRNSSILQS